MLRTHFLVLLLTACLYGIEYAETDSSEPLVRQVSNSSKIQARQHTQRIYYSLAAALRDGDLVGAKRHLFALRRSGENNPGLLFGLRIGIALKKMDKNGWLLQSDIAQKFSKAILPEIKHFSCQQALFSEIAMHLLRHQDAKTAIRIAKTYRSVPNILASHKVKGCSSIGLQALLVALGNEKATVDQDQRFYFWVQANVIIFAKPPLLTVDQRKNFTEVAIEHRLENMSRSKAYRFLAEEARYYRFDKYASYLETKAKESSAE